MNKYLIIVLLFMLNCQPKESKQLMINRAGALRSIMHQGQIQANVAIDTLIKEHLYGLGALDSLKGELIIWDGIVYTSRVNPNDSLPYMFVNQDVAASLLVYTHVDNWDTLVLKGTGALDLMVAKLAESRGFNTPFPFVLLGNPKSVGYHVINFDPKNADINDHKKGAFVDTLKNEYLSILGFYSTQDHGIFTHHDSNMHLHFINHDSTVLGHIDGIELSDQHLKILLPRL